MQVTVLVGDPIIFDDLLNVEENQNISRGKLYDAICARIGDHLRKLKAQVDRLAIEQSLQSQNYPTQVSKREHAAKILQQVDWESLGMETFTRPEDYALPSQHDKLTQPRVNQPQLFEKAFQGQYFKTGCSWGEGIVSRIQGYRESTALMGLAARGLFMNYFVKENLNGHGGVSPLKVWNRIWKSMYENHDPMIEVLGLAI